MIFTSQNIILRDIALILVGAVFFYSCTNKNTIKDWEELNESTKPEIVGKNIEIKQSRNGIVTFKAYIPKTIEQYKDDNPYIYICPDGIHVWQYDSISNTNFELTADSAYVIEPEQYYELWGNVTIERKQDSTMAVTDYVFIEQQKNLVHSDAKIVINKLNQIRDAVAEGFQSDLAFNNPVFYNITQGEVNYENIELRKNQDSITSDKLNKKQPETR
ncbi:LPS export ABC transporter protein LptC [Balneicella halophila]|uniref:LPS export ABC transporter protein LptC n=1 Tax=Balneicella halophila TaxID=1537566 RepID=A0A7L4UNN1_BALHA|nr:LPS export ABC transporter periplasmic protein LptC [Balneicella halophila]PVX50793.1 LPS export ABC transporter protein LptC [Balneicella halophila]